MPWGTVKIYALHSWVFLGSVDGCKMDQKYHMSLLTQRPVLHTEIWLTALDNSIDQQGSALLWNYINKCTAKTRECRDINIYD